MGKDIDLLRGTLDMLILKPCLGPQHGYGVLLRIQQLAKGNLQIEQGEVLPADPRWKAQLGSNAKIGSDMVR